jgi:ankyrin repeat protein
LRALLDDYLEHSFFFRNLDFDRLEVNSVGLDDETPLHKACREGAVEAVELLLACGAHVDARNDIGATALQSAVIKGSKPIVELLLAAGADVDARTREGVTALRLAEGGKQFEILELLRRAQASKA